MNDLTPRLGLDTGAGEGRPRYGTPEAWVAVHVTPPLLNRPYFRYDKLSVSRVPLIALASIAGRRRLFPLHYVGDDSGIMDDC